MSNDFAQKIVFIKALSFMGVTNLLIAIGFWLQKHGRDHRWKKAGTIHQFAKYRFLNRRPTNAHKILDEMQAHMLLRKKALLVISPSHTNMSYLVC